VYNVDETGISTVQKSVQKILGKKGKRQVGKVKSGERGVNTTVVCCVSTMGNYVPPLIIFKMKKEQKGMPIALEFGKPWGSIVRLSETRYIHKGLFLEWLVHFQKFTNCSCKKSVLLLLGGHTKHSKNLPALNFCRDNRTLLLQLPSHTTHQLQPLDVAFFKPLQNYFSSAESGWLADKANAG